MKKVFIIISMIIVAGMGLYWLAPYPSKPSQQVADVMALEANLQDLTAADDPPRISVAVVEAGDLVTSAAFGLVDGPNGWVTHSQIDAIPPTSLIGTAVEAVRLAAALSNGDTLPSADSAERPFGWEIWGCRTALDGCSIAATAPGFATIMRVFPDKERVIIINANAHNLDREKLIELIANIPGAWTDRSQ